MVKLNIKKIVIVLAIIAAFVGLIYGTITVLCKIYLQPKNIKEILISQVQKRFDRTITVSDDIELIVDWDMSPNIILHKFTLSNSTWASKPHIFTAETIELNFSLVDLLFKKLSIHSIQLVKPQLFLEVNNTKNNLRDLQNDMHSPGETTISLNVHKVSVTKGLLAYNADRYKVDKLDLTMNGEGKYHLILQGMHEKLPIKANIKLSQTDAAFKVELANLQVGNSDLKGNIELDYQPTRIKGKLQSKNLVLKDFTSDSPSSGEYTIPTILIPIEILRGAVFDLHTKFDMINLGGLKFYDVSIQTQNDNNVLRINCIPAATIVNGKLSLDVTYDLNPEVPQLNIQARTSTLQLSDVLVELFDKSPISGSSFDFMANLNGTGAELNALVGSLSGQILMQAGPGEFLNSTALTLSNLFTNVLTSVITFDKTVPTSAFKCGVMNFRVRNGVATAKQGVAIEAANVNVLGNGMIDLRTGRIAFSMVPQSLSLNPMNIANFSVAQLVEINGTISNPNVSINPTNLLAQGTTALVSAGIAGGLTGGIGSVLATAGLLNKSNTPADFSPCKTALSQ